MRSMSESPRDQIATNPSWGRRLAGIEGLRGIAAMAVVIAHLANETTSRLKTDNGVFWSLVGNLSHGLTLFFVLSGFLLFRPFVSAAMTNRPAPDTGRFLHNRVLRIFPGYISILLLTSFVFQTARLSTETATSKYEASGVMGLGDTLVTMPLLQTFSPAHMHAGLGVAWSLSVELTFYLALPLLAYGALRLRRRAGRSWAEAAVLPGLALLVTGLIGKAWLVWNTSGMTDAQKFEFEWGYNWSAVVARSMFVHGDLFAYGMFVALMYVAFETGRLAVSSTPMWRLAAASAMLVSLALAARHVVPGYENSFAAIAAASLLVFVLLSGPDGRLNWAARILETPPMRWLGLVSYGVYLWHIPVIWWLQKRDLLLTGDSIPRYLGNLAWVSGITLVLAAASYHLVEKPALALKKRTDAREAPAALAA
jgi:peptidoglycan/LPS O-acetylase OafA/YrhL